MVPTCPVLKKQKTYEASYLKKRQRLLSGFLHRMLASPELSACPIVVDFLQFKDEKAFSKSLKNSLDKDRPPKTVQAY